MKKFMLDLAVKKNVSLSTQYTLLILTCADKLPEILPGQFAEVRVDGSATTFLRRPISIHYVDYDTNELWLLVQVIGDGTRKMAALKAGETVNILLPLGNSFSLPDNNNGHLLLVGGGCGVAPLLYLGAYLHKKGFTCSFLLGGRSKSDLLQLDEYAKYGKVFTTTEDGTAGEKGFVTQHSLLNASNFNFIYTCGPTPMMKAVAAYATRTSVSCEVSLENTMACGIGACLCCVTDTTEGHVCVCTEGPVFNITKLKWQI